MKAYVKRCVKYNDHTNDWMASSGQMDKYADCVIPVKKVEDIRYAYKDLHGGWWWPANTLIIITEQNKHKYQNKKEFLS